MATFIPFHKGGYIETLTIFTRISLLPVLSKLVGQIMKKRLIFSHKIHHFKYLTFWFSIYKMHILINSVFKNKWTRDSYSCALWFFESIWQFLHLFRYFLYSRSLLGNNWNEIDIISQKIQHFQYLTIWFPI